MTSSVPRVPNQDIPERCPVGLVSGVRVPSSNRPKKRHNHLEFARTTQFQADRAIKNVFTDENVVALLLPFQINRTDQIDLVQLIGVLRLRRRTYVRRQETCQAYFGHGHAVSLQHALDGSVATFFQILLLGPLIKRTTGRNMRILAVSQNRNDLIAITELCTAGKVRPLIDNMYSFDGIPEAMRYVSDGHARGKVVITVEIE